MVQVVKKLEQQTLILSTELADAQPTRFLGWQAHSQATRHCAPDALSVPVQAKERRFPSSALVIPGGSSRADIK